MSRIGNNPISLPEGVSYTFDDKAGVITVKGPKGELSQDVSSDFAITLEDGMVVVKRPSDQKRHKALHGLYRSLISNMVVGVSEGYKKELELKGVGFKASVQGSVLEMSLGYSHNIHMALPPEIKASAESPKGKSPLVTLESIDKQLIGQVAAKIKSLRKVEPYKQKGIRFVGEHVRKKAGKQAAK